MEQLTEQKIIETIIKWCEGATDNVADGVRFKEVAKELSESTPIEGITDDRYEEIWSDVREILHKSNGALTGFNLEILNNQFTIRRK